MEKIRTAVIGMGYWGPKFARNLLLHPDFELIAVADTHLVKASKELQLLNALNVHVYSDIESLLKSEEVDLVHIAVPPQFHIEVAEKALNSGKHLLLEKPVGLNSSERSRILELALVKNLRVFVDHTYLFTSEFEAIRAIIEDAEIGELIFLNSTRINLGLIQSQTTVIEDLAVHDLAILDALLPELPDYVICSGMIVSPSKVVSTAFATIVYKNGFMAQIMVSWNSPVKVREIQLAGTEGMLIWDDMAGADKIKLYNSRIEQDISSEDLRISYHLGEGRIPSIISSEAIKRELSYISSDLRGEGHGPINGAEHIRRVGMVLSALKESLEADGMKVFL